MARTHLFPVLALDAERARPDALLVLLVSIAVALPVVSGIVYPTYVHYVTPRWFEWTRLQELPFVAFEMITCAVASRKGLDVRSMVKALPADIRIALAVLLAGIWIGSVMLSNDAAQSIAMSISTMIHLLFALSVVHLLRATSAKRVEPIMPALAIGVGVLAIFTAWRFATPPPAHTVPGGMIEWSAAIPGFISIRHFGAWTGAVAAGFVVAILFDRNSDRFNWHHAGYLLCTTATVWSATRAAMLAMLVAAVVAVLALRRLPSFSAIVRTGFLTALAFILAGLLSIDDTPFRLYSSGEYATFDSASSGRAELWRLTFWRWLDSPIFGWGTGSTFWEVYAGWTHTQPHNAVLQFLISWGLVGASAAIYLLVRAIARVHGVGMAEDRLRPLVAVLYALLFQSLLEGMLHYPRFIEAIFFLFAVIIVATAMQPQTSEASGRRAGREARAG